MSQAVLNTFYQVFLPISLPVLCGWLLRRYQNLDTKPLLTLTLYVLNPAVLFHALAKAELASGMIWEILAFSLLNLLLLWLAANVLGRLLQLSAPNLAGLTMVTTFTNSVNYGLPLVLLAFGQAGMDYASVYVVYSMILMNTAGVYFAARSHFSMKDAVKSVFKLPAIYAAIAAGIVQWIDFQMPTGLDKGISMMAASFSPLVLCILGAQMANVGHDDLDTNHRKAFWSGLIFRLFLSPLLAWLVLRVLGIEGTQFMVLLILASMPVAVNAVVLAEKFDASPKIVSKCILWTTLASFIVLPVIIGLHL